MRRNFATASPARLLAGSSAIAPVAAFVLMSLAGTALWPAPLESTGEQKADPITWREVLALPHPAADHRIEYGDGEFHFGELRLPTGDGPFPVVVLIHGGCWLAEFDLDYMASTGAALVDDGVAIWTLEYRRIGNPGGGWPGTFEDVARGVDHLRVLAKRFPLDLDRVVLAGHSAGGHLALWLAARHVLPETSPLYAPDPLGVRGVVSLAGITDLVSYGEGPRDCNAAVARLIGGTPDDLPRRYIDGNPAALLPLGVPTRLVQGRLDPIVAVEQARDFRAAAEAKGDDSRLLLIEGAGHFDLTAPSTAAWPTVRKAILGLLADQEAARAPSPCRIFRPCAIRSLVPRRCAAYSGRTRRSPVNADGTRALFRRLGCLL